jgi:1,2-phenylacetyl-CoA epoxidase PaaB subunit
MSDGDRLWEVFARRKRADHFEHIGCVEAPNPDLGRVYAWQTYDEAPVNRPEQPFTLHPPSEALT